MQNETEKKTQDIIVFATSFKKQAGNWLVEATCSFFSRAGEYNCNAINLIPPTLNQVPAGASRYLQVPSGVFKCLQVFDSALECLMCFQMHSISTVCSTIACIILYKNVKFFIK